MKVEVETQPHCVATLKIELPPEDVSKEWDAIANSFARQARIPGYRPGKAPKRVIEACVKGVVDAQLKAAPLPSEGPESMRRWVLRTFGAGFGKHFL